MKLQTYCFLAALVLQVQPSRADADTLAMALDLPKDGLSFWYLSKRSSFGVELELQQRWFRDSEWTNTDSLRIGLGLVFQRAWTDPDELYPFWFLRFNGAHNTYDRRPSPKSGRVSGWSIVVLDMGIELGVGVAWKPFDRVALWVRQGISLSGRGWTSDHPTIGRPGHAMGKVVLTEPVVLAVFSW